MKLSLYPDWKAGDISREEYHRLKEQFEQQQGKLDTRIAALQTRIDKVQNGVDETNSFLSQFVKYRNLQNADARSHCRTDRRCTSTRAAKSR